MKVMMICNTDGALYVFRKPLIRRLIGQGHEVVSVTSRTWYVEKLKELGVRTHVVDFEGRSVSPMANLGLLNRLRILLRQERPEIVHAFTHKPAVYGSFAAWLAGAGKIFVTITGLGTAFSYNDRKTRIIRLLLLLQYRVALRFSKRVYFQNPDDLDYFTGRGIARKEKAVLVNGSGIDLAEYAVPTIGETSRLREALGREIGTDLKEKIVVIFPARALREKGFYDVYESARMINRQSAGYVFLHLGYVDERST
ncbi:MAG: glycosyltransferase, partial [bacterium]